MCEYYIACVRGCHGARVLLCVVELVICHIQMIIAYHLLESGEYYIGITMYRLTQT